MKYLVDTDWVINHVRGSERVSGKLEELAAEGLALSVVSLAQALKNPKGQSFMGFAHGYLEPVIVAVLSPLSRSLSLSFLWSPLFCQPKRLSQYSQEGREHIPPAGAPLTMPVTQSLNWEPPDFSRGECQGRHWAVTILVDSRQFGILNGDGGIGISFWNGKPALFEQGSVLLHPPFRFVKTVLHRVAYARKTF